MNNTSIDYSQKNIDWKNEAFDREALEKIYAMEVSETKREQLLKDMRWENLAFVNTKMFELTTGKFVGGHIQHDKIVSFNTIQVKVPMINVLTQKDMHERRLACTAFISEVCQLIQNGYHPIMDKSRSNTDRRKDPAALLERVRFVYESPLVTDIGAWVRGAVKGGSIMEDYTRHFNYFAQMKYADIAAITEELMADPTTPVGYWRDVIGGAMYARNQKTYNWPSVLSDPTPIDWSTWGTDAAA